jgi:hypothetical protein
MKEEVEVEVEVEEGGGGNKKNKEKWCGWWWWWWWGGGGRGSRREEGKGSEKMGYGLEGNLNCRAGARGENIIIKKHHNRINGNPGRLGAVRRGGGSGRVRVGSGQVRSGTKGSQTIKMEIREVMVRTRVIIPEWRDRGQGNPRQDER